VVNDVGYPCNGKDRRGTEKLVGDQVSDAENNEGVCRVDWKEALGGMPNREEEGAEKIEGGATNGFFALPGIADEEGLVGLGAFVGF